MHAPLPERQIAAQHRETCSDESLGHGDQQSRPAIGPCAVRQHQAVAHRSCWPVQEAAHRWQSGDFLGKWVAHSVF